MSNKGEFEIIGNGMNRRMTDSKNDCPHYPRHEYCCPKTDKVNIFDHIWYLTPKDSCTHLYTLMKRDNKIKIYIDGELVGKHKIDEAGNIL